MDPEDKDSKKFGQVVDTLHSKQKLSSLRTYQGDMAEFIKEKNESVLSIAAKEKKRKEEREKEEKEEKPKKNQLTGSEGSLKSRLGRWAKFEVKGKVEEKNIEPEIESGIKFETEPQSESETEKIEEIEDIEEKLEPKAQPKVEPTIEHRMVPEKEIFHKAKNKNTKTNFTLVLGSLLLVALGIFAALYSFKFVKKEPVAQVVITTEVIPYNHSVDLSGVTKENLGSKIAQITPANGVSILRISTVGDATIRKAKDFFNLLDISLPGALIRTLKDQYVVGVISQNNSVSTFLVITVNDFGSAFSSMLDWEVNMEKDLSFFGVATSTDTFVWKDIIVKNKDTRDLVNKYNQAKIAYTFLDKNTILITSSLSAIGEMSSAYASRSFVR
ncbi:MAG: hypothetical protein AAB446_03475 [Patescibacteria group bacterium]